MKAVFWDKDGTLIENVPDNICPELIRLNPGAREALSKIFTAGFINVVITNQAGVARGYFQMDELIVVRERIRYLMENEAGVPLEGFYFCPHHPDGSIRKYSIQCPCRKPQPGMILQAAREMGINLTNSWVIGDILNDIEAGHRAGCRAVLLDNGNETEWQLSDHRIPDSLASDLEEAADRICSM